MLTVGVFVDADEATLRQCKETLNLGCLQLHGDEPPELLERFLPHAFKALRVRGDQVARDAARYGGDHLLLDAYVPGHHGGTGARFDWHVAAQLGAARKHHARGRPDLQTTWLKPFAWPRRIAWMWRAESRAGRE